MLINTNKPVGSVYGLFFIRIGFALALVLVIFSTIKVVFAYRYAKERLASAQIDHTKTVKEYDKLKEQYTNVTTTEGFEYYIRDQYRAVAEGEELVVLVDPNAAAPQKIELSEKRWWETLLDKIQSL